jgi:hypothetical protein
MRALLALSGLVATLFLAFMASNTAAAPLAA